MFFQEKIYQYYGHLTKVNVVNNSNKLYEHISHKEVLNSSVTAYKKESV